MDAVNINDSIRKVINEKLTNGKDFDDKKIKTNACFFYDELKKDKKALKMVVNVIYLTSYLVTKNAHVMYPKDKACKDDLEFLKSINFTEELISIMDEDIFYNLCRDTVLFFNTDNYVKRKIVSRINKQDIDLFRKVPIIFYDILTYLKKYDISDVVKYYNKRLKDTNDKNVSLEDAVCYGVELLIKLSEDDPDNYRKVMYNIVSQYYTYNKYLLLNNYEMDEYAFEILDLIEDGFEELIAFSLNNYALLEPVVRDFITYNSLSVENKNKIDKFHNKRNCNAENQFYKNNYNCSIRKFLSKLFKNIDFDDDVVVLKYKNKLDYIKNMDEFDYIANVLYTDLFSNIYISYDINPDDAQLEYEFNFIKSFNNMNDFKRYLLEDDMVLLDAIDNSIYFDELPLLSKKSVIENIKGNNIYDYFITKEYVNDMIEYSRDFSLYDAYLIYENNLISEKDRKIAIALSVNDLKYDLLDLEALYENNYDDIIYDICDICYKYNRYKIDFENLKDDDCISMVNDIEKDFDLFLFNVKQDSEKQEKVLSSFYEYVSCNEFEKQRVQIHFKELLDKGKVKKFNKKNKNS